MAFLDLDGLKTFLSGCDNRYAPKSHSHTQYLNMNESRTANTVLAGPNGSAGVATFRKLVANDIPSISKSKISDFPSSMPASDVYSWAKASSKPSYSFSEISGKVNASTQLTGTVPSSCLPSYVDDVLEYNGLASFPETGESGKIYTDTSTNKVYRWGGSSYVVISDTIALGTTSSTAYRGDLGNEAHSWASTAKAHADKHGSAFASGLYKITTNDAGHVTGATAVAKSDITALGIPSADTHYTANLVVGASSSATANATTANGTTFLNLVENGGVRNSHQIKGAGATTVSADANGVITITSTDTKTTNTWRPCVDNLTSTATDQSLSANQGRILNNKFADYVPTSRTVNGKALTSNIVLTASDVSASAVGHTHSYAGSSTPGGPATSANKLNYTHTNEINFGGGKQETCYINYRNADSDVSDGNSAIQYKFCNYSDDTTKTTIVASRFQGTATIADRVTGGNATADAARHVWFSDASTEAARVSNDNFKYNPVGNIATCNISGNAASANTIVGSYTGNGGQQKPNYFGINRVGSLMMNTPVNGDTSYKNWLIMDPYGADDAGGASAIGVSRSDARAFIMSSTAARTDWNYSAELISTKNIGSQSVSYATSAGSASSATTANSATTATTATQLSSSAGSATNPIYFSNGKPTACTFSLNKTVPSNAVFTDTWKQLTGSTASASGTAGYAPAPSAGANNRYLRCDGTWVVPPDTNTDTKYSAGAGLSLSGTTFSLSSSGVTSGSYGPSSNVNGTNGTTISVPQITVDSYGRVTSIVNRTYTSVDTDTNTTYSAISKETITALFN